MYMFATGTINFRELNPLAKLANLMVVNNLWFYTISSCLCQNVHVFIQDLQWIL